MLFWTRHANLRRVENYIYDPSARIIKNPLNSTVFWKRRLNPATRRLNSATRSLNSATRQILHWNIVVYFDEASSQLGKASSQLGDASAQLRDASKMQLWPQWLTIAHSTGGPRPTVTYSDPRKGPKAGAQGACSAGLYVLQVTDFLCTVH